MDDSGLACLGKVTVVAEDRSVTVRLGAVRDKEPSSISRFLLDDQLYSCPNHIYISEDSHVEITELDNTLVLILLQ